MEATSSISRRSKMPGFTLVELMIVIAIIGILSSIALPAYQNYSIRAQVSEGLALASGIKTSIAEYYGDRGAWPADSATLGKTQTIAGSYVSSVTVSGGAITVNYGNNANATHLSGRAVSIRPALAANGDVAWVCGYAVPPSGATVSGTDATTVDAKYLSASCR